MRQKSLIFMLLYTAISSPALPQSDPQTVVATTQRMLELERLVLDETAKSREDLRSEIATELSGHRDYLQQLNDRFYDRFSFWLPIASGALAVLFATFLWQVGKTQKDAYEAAQLVAVSKATELAARKVNEIVIPARVITEAEKLSNQAIEEITRIKTEMVKELREELTAARDQVVQDKHELIMDTLEEAIGQRFSDEVDILSRVRRVEKATETLKQAFLGLVEPLRKPDRTTAAFEGVVRPMLHAVPFGGTIATLIGDARQRRRDRELLEAIDRVASIDS